MFDAKRQTCQYSIVRDKIVSNKHTHTHKQTYTHTNKHTHSNTHTHTGHIAAHKTIIRLTISYHPTCLSDVIHKRDHICNNN